MTSLARVPLILCCALAFGACGGDDPLAPSLPGTEIGTDTGTDTATDTATDTLPDVESDTETEVDVEADADATDPDVEADADATVLDVEADADATAPDAAVDADVIDLDAGTDADVIDLDAGTDADATDPDADVIDLDAGTDADATDPDAPDPDADAVDPCDELELCVALPEAGSTCDGDDVVTCEDVDGCLVETGRETCLTTCDDSGDGPMCVPLDPCLDLACDPLTFLPSCAGHIWVICVTDDELGCDIVVESDCSFDRPGFTCVDDGFSASCAESPCGDGLFDGFVGEECDDGNNEDGDGCSAICMIEDRFACTVVERVSVCVAIVCGNGVIDDDEVCDDGNTDDDDGCSSSCTVEDGFVCTDEPSDCLVPECGDGVRSPGEACDDANTTDEDGCSSECWIEISPTGGATVSIEATIDGSEDQYERLYDDCSEDGPADHFFDAYTFVNITAAAIEISILATWLDDGYLHIFSGDFDPADPLASCLTGDDDFDDLRFSRIDDFILEPDSTYVLVASTFGGATIIGDYTIAMTTARCGDGAVNDLESCDDGNSDDGDGCSSTCTVEDGFECDDDPSVCFLPDVCGGGRVDGDEECDDGNTDDGDGCMGDCTIEDDFFCLGDPSVCVPEVCGDGILVRYEACDDGNTDDGDGCSSMCALELSSGLTTDLAGSIDESDALFSRAGADCLSVTTADYYHDVFPLVNPTGETLTVTATAEWSGDGAFSYDGYLHAYAGFDPANALLNCVASNDDFETHFDSQIIFPVGPATSSEIVATTFSSLEWPGAYTIEVEVAEVAP
jgi:cysteine-rich repeat protein